MRASRPLGATLIALALAGLPAVASAVAPAATPTTLTWRAKQLPVNGGYGEPSLAVSTKGLIDVCTPGGGGNNHWTSRDDGQTFSTTKTPGGGGDCEIDWLPNGDLIAADLNVQNSIMTISHDQGRTFQSAGTAGIEQDRQWLAHSPDGKTAYLVYHDFAAEGEFFARSKDGGNSWPMSDGANPVNSANQAAGVPQNPLAPPGSGATPSLLDQGANTFSGPMVVSPDGNDFYVVYATSDAATNLNPTQGTPPFGKGRGIVVAHASIEGMAFTNRYAVSAPPAPTDPAGTARDSVGAIFPWAFTDAKGTFYLVYNSDTAGDGHYRMRYVYSTDKGATFSKPITVSLPAAGTGEALYATGAGGAPGVIDVAWYQADKAASTGDITAQWTVQYAQVRNASTATPTVVERSQVLATPHHQGAICLEGILCRGATGDRSLLDFFELAIGPDGQAQVAFANNYQPTEKTGGHVYWAKQVGGRSAFDLSTATLPGVAAAQGTPTTVKAATTKSKPKSTQRKPAVSAPTTGLAATGLPVGLQLLGLGLLGLGGAALLVRGRRSAA